MVDGISFTVHPTPGRYRHPLGSVSPAALATATPSRPPLQALVVLYLVREVFQICREKAPLTICTGVVDAVVAARALRCQRTGGDCEVRRVMVPRTRPDGLAGIDGW